MTHLKVEDLVDGMTSCADNARKLAADARRLYGVRRYSSAGALAISSLEESGKVLLLSTAATTIVRKREPDWSEFWREWRKHDSKVKLASFLDLGAHGADAADLAMRAFILGDLSKLRERFIYVDRGTDSWIEPRNSDRSWVLELLDAAEALSERLATETNKKRREWAIDQLNTIALESSVDNPFIENLKEGFEAIQKRLERINDEIEGAQRGPAG